MANRPRMSQLVDVAGEIPVPNTYVLKTIASMGTVQSSTPTAAQLKGGIVTQTGATGAGTVTLPTGAIISASFAEVPPVGTSWTTFFQNVGGSQTLTITGATGTTVSGTVAVPTARNANLNFVCTGVNTWNVYVLLGA